MQGAGHACELPGVMGRLSPAELGVTDIRFTPVPCTESLIHPIYHRLLRAHQKGCKAQTCDASTKVSRSSERSCLVRLEDATGVSE